MAFEKRIYDPSILLLVLIGIPLIASTNIDCSGKSFQCLNSTHFMICVDLGGGVSKTVDDFVIPCPSPTVCLATNRFECEFPATPAPTVQSIVTTDTEATTLAWEQIAVTITSSKKAEEHLELSTVNNMPDIVPDPMVIPLQSVNTNDTGVTENVTKILETVGTTEASTLSTVINEPAVVNETMINVTESVVRIAATEASTDLTFIPLEPVITTETLSANTTENIMTVDTTYIITDPVIQNVTEVTENIVVVTTAAMPIDSTTIPFESVIVNKTEMFENVTEVSVITEPSTEPAMILEPVIINETESITSVTENLVTVSSTDILRNPTTILPELPIINETEISNITESLVTGTTTGASTDFIITPEPVNTNVTGNFIIVETTELPVDSTATSFISVIANETEIVANVTESFVITETTEDLTSPMMTLTATPQSVNTNAFINVTENFVIVETTELPVDSTATSFISVIANETEIVANVTESFVITETTEDLTSPMMTLTATPQSVNTNAFINVTENFVIVETTELPVDSTATSFISVIANETEIVANVTESFVITETTEDLTSPMMTLTATPQSVNTNAFINVTENFVIVETTELPVGSTATSFETVIVNETEIVANVTDGFVIIETTEVSTSPTMTLQPVFMNVPESITNSTENVNIVATSEVPINTVAVLSDPSIVNETKSTTENSVKLETTTVSVNHAVISMGPAITNESIVNVTEGFVIVTTTEAVTNPSVLANPGIINATEPIINVTENTVLETTTDVPLYGAILPGLTITNKTEVIANVTESFVTVKNSAASTVASFVETIVMDLTTAGSGYLSETVQAIENKPGNKDIKIENGAHLTTSVSSLTISKKPVENITQSVLSESVDISTTPYIESKYDVNVTEYNIVSSTESTHIENINDINESATNNLTTNLTTNKKELHPQVANHLPSKTESLSTLAMEGTTAKLLFITEISTMATNIDGINNSEKNIFENTDGSFVPVTEAVTTNITLNENTKNADLIPVSEASEVITSVEKNANQDSALLKLTSFFSTTPAVAKSNIVNSTDALTILLDSMTTLRTFVLTESANSTEPKLKEDNIDDIFGNSYANKTNSSHISETTTTIGVINTNVISLESNDSSNSNIPNLDLKNKTETNINQSTVSNTTKPGVINEVTDISGHTADVKSNTTKVSQLLTESVNKSKENYNNVLESTVPNIESLSSTSLENTPETLFITPAPYSYEAFTTTKFNEYEEDTNTLPLDLIATTRTLIKDQNLRNISVTLMSLKQTGNIIDEKMNTDTTTKSEVYFIAESIYQSNLSNSTPNVIPSPIAISTDTINLDIKNQNIATETTAAEVTNNQLRETHTINSASAYIDLTTEYKASFLITPITETTPESLLFLTVKENHIDVNTLRNSSLNSHDNNNDIYETPMNADVVTPIDVLNSTNRTTYLVTTEGTNSPNLLVKDTEQFILVEQKKNDTEKIHIENKQTHIMTDKLANSTDQQLSLQQSVNFNDSSTKLTNTEDSQNMEKTLTQNNHAPLNIHQNSQASTNNTEDIIYKQEVDKNNVSQYNKLILTAVNNSLSHESIGEAVALTTELTSANTIQNPNDIILTQLNNEALQINNSNNNAYSGLDGLTISIQQNNTNNSSIYANNPLENVLFDTSDNVREDQQYSILEQSKFVENVLIAVSDNTASVSNETITATTVAPEIQIVDTLAYENAITPGTPPSNEFIDTKRLTLTQERPKKTSTDSGISFVAKPGEKTQILDSTTTINLNINISQTNIDSFTETTIELQSIEPVLLLVTNSSTTSETGIKEWGILNEKHNQNNLEKNNITGNANYNTDFATGKPILEINFSKTTAALNKATTMSTLLTTAEINKIVQIDDSKLPYTSELLSPKIYANPEMSTAALLTDFTVKQNIEIATEPYSHVASKIDNVEAATIINVATKIFDNGLLQVDIRNLFNVEDKISENANSKLLFSENSPSESTAHLSTQYTDQQSTTILPYVEENTIANDITSTLPTETGAIRTPDNQVELQHPVKPAKSDVTVTQTTEKETIRTPDKQVELQNPVTLTKSDTTATLTTETGAIRTPDNQVELQHPVTPAKSDVTVTQTTETGAIRTPDNQVYVQHTVSPVIAEVATKSAGVSLSPTTAVNLGSLETSSNSIFDCKTRGRFADNNDCRKFYICSGIPQPIVGLCPVNTVFSEIRKQCTRNLSHCVRGNEFKCVAPGRYSDFLNQNIYYICVWRGNSFMKYKLQCQNGFSLNKTTVRCYKLPESQSVSQSVSIDNSQSVTEKKPKEEKKKEKKSKIKSKQDFECEEEGKFADPDDCRIYYICSKSNKSEEYRRKMKKCDKDEVFHKKKKKCVDAESYECS